MIKVGERFGAWEVIADTGTRSKNRDKYYLCKCECGTIRKVTASSLKNGRSRSCGKCKRKEANQKQAEVLKRINKEKAEKEIGKTISGFKVLEVYKKTAKNGREEYFCKAVCPICGSTTDTALWRLYQKESCKRCANNEAVKYIKKTKEISLTDGSSLAMARARLNGKVNKNSMTGTTGVFYRKNIDRYVAQLNFKHKCYYLGSYRELENAVAARKAAEKEILGGYLEENKGWEERLKNALNELKAAEKRDSKQEGE